jgi:hypothetical protein
LWQQFDDRPASTVRAPVCARGYSPRRAIGKRRAKFPTFRLRSFLALLQAIALRQPLASHPAEPAAGSGRQIPDWHTPCCDRPDTFVREKRFRPQHEVRVAAVSDIIVASVLALMLIMECLVGLTRRRRD